MQIITLGTSHGSHTRTRYSSATLLDIGGDCYLIDCGEPCSATYRRLGYDFSRLRALFVTHMHADHISGILMLTSELRTGAMGQTVDYCVPAEGVEPIQALLRAAYIFPQLTTYTVRFHALRPGPVFADERLQVTAEANSHMEGVRQFVTDRGYPHTMESYSFVFAAEGKRVLYSGDLPADFAELARFAASPCDLLIMEMTHIRPEAVFPVLADLPIGGLLLNHIHDPWQTPEGEAHLLALAEKNLPFPCVVAAEGMAVTV